MNLGVPRAQSASTTCAPHFCALEQAQPRSNNNNNDNNTTQALQLRVDWATTNQHILQWATHLIYMNPLN